MNSMKIGRQELLTENIKSLIVQAESSKKKGITRDELQIAMTNGAKIDIEQGFGKVKNPDCVKNFTLLGFQNIYMRECKILSS